MPLDEFARVNLFEPLGIQDYRWRHVPINRITGQGNLSITTRDLAAIGELILSDGVVNGQRLVSHNWIARSLASQVAIADSDPYADFYGYMWYTKAEPINGRNIEAVSYTHLDVYKRQHFWALAPVGEAEGRTELPPAKSVRSWDVDNSCRAPKDNAPFFRTCLLSWPSRLLLHSLPAHG